MEYQDAGHATGAVRTVLRLEGLAPMVTAGCFYAGTDAGWEMFALLFLAPDLSMLGYLAGPRAGAAAYNLAHSTIGPLALAALGWSALPAALPLALIWLAHVGFDRTLGYGLKYGIGFGATHLGRIGRASG